MSGELDNFGFHTHGMSFYSMAAVKTEQRNLLSEKAREDHGGGRGKSSFLQRLRLPRKAAMAVMAAMDMQGVKKTE